MKYKWMQHNNDKNYYILVTKDAWPGSNKHRCFEVMGGQLIPKEISDLEDFTSVKTIPSEVSKLFVEHIAKTNQ